MAQALFFLWSTENTHSALRCDSAGQLHVTRITNIKNTCIEHRRVTPELLTGNKSVLFSVRGLKPPEQTFRNVAYYLCVLYFSVLKCSEREWQRKITMLNKAAVDLITCHLLNQKIIPLLRDPVLQQTGWRNLRYSIRHKCAFMLKHRLIRSLYIRDTFQLNFSKETK